MSSLSAALAEELRGEPRWMYPWELGNGRTAPLLGATLPAVHQTRLEMIQRPVAEALAAAGPSARALDIACCEGWFSQRLLEFGAGTVLGADAREVNIRRARLVRDHYGIPAERLSFQVSDAFDLDVDALGQFDVVLMLGLLYHVENPMELIRRARALTRGLCVIETQVTRQERPVLIGTGLNTRLMAAAASFAALVEDTSELSTLAAVGGVISLVPNRAALSTMIERAGFEQFEFVEPAFHHDRQYKRGDRVVVLAR